MWCIYWLCKWILGRWWRYDLCTNTSKSIKIAKGFSMNILCYDINQNEDLEREYNVKYVDLDTLCKFSDVIMLHAPLTSHNYHMIDKRKISLMKDTAVIVNTARGELPGPTKNIFICFSSPNCTMQFMRKAIQESPKKVTVA